jgi:uncharacterized protein with PIN domain
MKFIADVMLGRLAKRMRLLGFDVLYDRSLDDNGIIRLSLEHDRVVLTRDKGLAARPLAMNHLFIINDRVQDQLRQVRSAFPLEPVQPLTRCSECNTPLTQIEKSDAQEQVPQHVYEQTRDFLHCSTCGRIYWKGSHVQRMELSKKSRP